MTHRLLLVDDHPVVRAGYQRLLEQEGDLSVVAQAGTVDEACALHARCAPDLTITDLAMPGSGGLELIRRLRLRESQARVLVFSMHDSALLLQRAAAIGACGFVSKSAAPEQLLAAVRAALASRRFPSGGEADRRRAGGAGEGAEPPGLRPMAGASAAESPIDSLTAREFEVFRLLAAGGSAAECARCLHLSPKTIANHQSLIKEKLGVATSAAMAHLAIRHGVILPGIG